MATGLVPCSCAISSRARRSQLRVLISSALKAAMNALLKQFVNFVPGWNVAERITCQVADASPGHSLFDLRHFTGIHPARLFGQDVFTRPDCQQGNRRQQGMRRSYHHNIDIAFRQQGILDREQLVPLLAAKLRAAGKLVVLQRV